MFYEAPNISFLAVIIAIPLLVLTFLYRHKLKVQVIVCTVIFLYALIDGFRTVIIVEVVMLATHLYLKKQLPLKTLFLTILLLPLFFIKQDSTKGRFFILKTTINIISKNPLGIGINKFRVAYNLEQASYFASHSITNETALLADNTHFALNEYLQLVCEIGIPFGIALILFVIATFLVGVKFYRTNSNKILFIAILVFTGLSVASITFYFLHNWYCFVFFISSAIIIWSFYLQIKKFCTLSYIGLIIAISVTFFNHLNYNISKRIVREASILSANGFKKIADSLFTLPKSKGADILYHQSIAQHLNRFGQPDLATEILLKVNTKVTSSENYQLIGDAYFKMGNYQLAEQNFLMSLYIAPNRFASRQKLVELYAAQRDTTSELKWLNAIIELPEKIPSSFTRNTKKNAYKRIEILLK